MSFDIHKSSMLSHQKKWWDLPNFYRLLVAGFGAGKTYIGALRALWLSSENAPIPGQYVSPTYPLAKKTILITLQEIMERSEIQYRFHKTDHQFFIHNWNGQIWIGSGEDPDSLRGPNLAWAGIDEPFIQNRQVFDIMISRVRHPDTIQKEIFMTGTPEELNWGHEVAMNDAGKYDLGLVFGSTRDNIYLPDTYVETMLSAFTEEQVKAFIDGKFVPLTAGRVCKQFDRDRHVVKHPDLERILKEEKIPIEAGVDFNVDYMTAELYFDISGHIHYFDEIRLSNADTFELADEMGRRKNGTYLKCYPDATGKARKTSATKSDHQILRDAGFGVISHVSNPPVKERVNAFNRLLKDDRITIEPGKCPELVADCERMKWKRGDLDKVSDPARTHAFDAASYPVEYKHPLRSRTLGSAEW